MRGTAAQDGNQQPLVLLRKSCVVLTQRASKEFRRVELAVIKHIEGIKTN